MTEQEGWAWVATGFALLALVEFVRRLRGKEPFWKVLKSFVVKLLEAFSGLG